MKKVIAAIAAVCIIVSGHLYYNFCIRPVISAIPVKTFTVKNEQLVSKIECSGTVEGIEVKRIYIPEGTKINNILIKEGDKVKKGQRLFYIDDKVQRLTLEQAEIEEDIQMLLLQNLKNKKRIYNDNSREDTKNNINGMNINGIYYGEKDIDDVIAVQIKRAEAVQLMVRQTKNMIENLNALCFSPIDGTVTELNMRDGELAASAVCVLVVQDTGRMKAKAYISENDAQHVKIGQKVLISYNMAENQTFEGHVAEISASVKNINAGQGNDSVIGVDIEFAGRPELKPGANVDMEILLADFSDMPVVPYEAINEYEDGRKTVFVIRNGQSFEQDVKVGLEADLFAGISDGLQEGDIVVSNPCEKLRSGSRISVCE